MKHFCKHLLIQILMLWIINSCKKEEVIPATVTDIDSNIYHTISIGKEVWMVENLKVTHYSNGDDIQKVTDNRIWKGLNNGAYCNYDNNDTNANCYGHLYNWYAVNDNRKIAPIGWRIPTHADWAYLEAYLGGSSVAGGKIKDTTVWAKPNISADNSSGFTALPGGYRDGDDFGYYHSVGSSGYWWSVTDDIATVALIRMLYYNSSEMYTGKCLSRKDGFSIRCIKD